MKKVLNGVCVILGFLFLGIGMVGIVLPILPTTPFLLLSALLFAKGSKKFHKWFVETKIYKKYIESAFKNKEMTIKSKIKVLITISLLLTCGFVLSPIWYAKAFIILVAIGHYYYFLFRIKSVKVECNVAQHKKVRKKENSQYVS